MTGFSFSRTRVLQVIGIVVLVIVGVALPYLTIVWQNPASEIVVFRGSLFPSANFVGGLEPLDLPDYSPGEKAQQIVLALNVMSAGPSLHQIGAVVAIITVACLFQNEINKWWWWPLHLAGWLLAVAFIPLLVGAALLSLQQVEYTVLPAWVMLTGAGVVVLVCTFKSRHRIDR
ncbi:MAG: hypothetical protein K0S98_692 [Propionibacteriaceae bacterium]|nr:hypothetical protein [Propionibacteriaceae bacterium]